MRSRLTGVWEEREILVRIYDAPCTTCVGVVVRDTLLGSLVNGSFGVKCISIFIFGGADGSRTRYCIALDDRVLVTIELRVNTKTEEMLMTVCIDSGMDLSSPAVSRFAGVHDISIQNTCQFQFKLNISICVERPITEVRFKLSEEYTSSSRSWQR